MFSILKNVSLEHQPLIVNSNFTGFKYTDREECRRSSLLLLWKHNGGRDVFAVIKNWRPKTNGQRDIQRSNKSDAVCRTGRKIWKKYYLSFLCAYFRPAFSHRVTETTGKQKGYHHLFRRVSRTSISRAKRQQKAQKWAVIKKKYKRYGPGELWRTSEMRNGSITFIKNVERLRIIGVNGIMIVS